MKSGSETGLDCYKYVFVFKSGFEGNLPENTKGTDLKTIYS